MDLHTVFFPPVLYLCALTNELTGVKEPSASPGSKISATSINLGSDIFIGRPTMAKERLYDRLRGHLHGDLSFALNDDQIRGLPGPPLPARTHVSWSDEVSLCCGAHAAETTAFHKSDLTRLAGEMVVEDSKKYLDPIEANDGIKWKDVEAPWQSALDGKVTSVCPPLKVHGTVEERQIFMALNADASDVFSVAVQKETARVDPYEIDMELEEWQLTFEPQCRSTGEPGDAGSSERPDRIVA